MYTQTLSGLTVAQLLLKYLKLEGVSTIFGVPGGAIKTVLSELALDTKTFTFVVCRQETGAAFMAEGYARLSGLPGVIMVTSGPGATNAITGVMNGHVDNHSLIAITGETPEQLWGKGFLQEGIDGDIDVNAMYQAATAYSAIVTHPNNFQELFTTALRYALSLPHQTVHISLPDDVAAMQPFIMNTATPPAPVYQCSFPVSSSSYRVTPASCDPAGTAAALASLLAANFPVIFLGNGCRDGLSDPGRLANLIAFAEKFQIPITTTPDAKGLFPESHPLSLRNYGMAASAWSVSYTSGPSHDALLIVASALDELDAAGEVTLGPDLWSTTLIPKNDGPIVQVDLDPHAIGRVFPISQGIVAEAGLFVDNLCAFGTAQTITPALQQLIQSLRDPHRAQAQRTGHRRFRGVQFRRLAHRSARHHESPERPASQGLKHLRRLGQCCRLDHELPHHRPALHHPYRARHGCDGMVRGCGHRRQDGQARQPLHLHNR
jgi:acetolactate synthase-1/2/3 large subunit